MATYYVATTGNDGNAGTIGSPWLTIQHAVTQPLNPGDTIYIRAGTYDETHNGQFTANNQILINHLCDSGTQANPITLASYPGETAIIDGEFSYPPGDVSTGIGDPWNRDGLIAIEDGVSWWTFERLEIKRSRGNALNVNYQVSVEVTSNGIALEDCYVHDNRKGVVIFEGDYHRIEDSEFYYNECWRDGGETTSNWAPTLRIIDSDHSAIRRCLCHYSFGEGLRPIGCTDFTLEDCIIHDTAHTATGFNRCQNSLMQRNLIYQTGPAGKPAGLQGARAVGISTSHDLGGSYKARKYRCKNLTIINNLVIGCESGYRAAVWHSGTPGINGMENVLIAHNTWVHTVDGGESFAGNIMMVTAHGAVYSNVTFANNIILQDSDYGKVVYQACPPGVSSHHNLWYELPLAVGWTSGTDAHGDPDLAAPDAPPLTTTPDAEDYQLTDTSPAIDAGAFGYATGDYWGGARDEHPDLGFHEFGGEGPLPSVLSIDSIIESSDPIYISGCPAPNTVMIQADVTSSAGIDWVRLYYNPPGSLPSEPMTYVAMGPAGGDTYTATIGPFSIIGTLYYQVTARDNDGNQESSGYGSVFVFGCSGPPPDICTEACFCLEFDDELDEVDFGSGANLDDLPTVATFTAEAWIKPSAWGIGSYGRILSKSDTTSPGTGWFVQLHSSYGLAARANYATTDAVSYSGLDEFTIDGDWHHVVAVHTAATKTWHLAIDGTWVTSYALQQVGVGAYASDAAESLMIGNNDENTQPFVGQIGLSRLSSGAAYRYTPGVDFTPPDRFTVFADDADTEGIWICDNTGNVVYDCSSNNNDGTMVGAAWVQTGCPSGEPEPGEEPGIPEDLRGHEPPLTYSLTLKPSVVSSIGSVAPQDITDLARNWTRSTRLQGGFWTGTFSVPGNKRIFDAFDTWLGSHIEERSGGLVTWEGYIAEMELSTGGFVYRVSLDDMWNKVRANYYDPNWSGLNETAWATNDLSIARFGTKEYQFDINTISTAEAEAARDRFVMEHGWPWPRPVSICPLEQEELRVTVCGYVFMLQWQYLSGGACWMPNWDDCMDAPGGCDQDTPACDMHYAYDFAGDLGYNSEAEEDSPAPGEYILQSTTSTDIVVPLDLSPYETLPGSVVIGDIDTYAHYMVSWRNNGDGVEGWAYCGETDTILAVDDSIHLYLEPTLQTEGANPATLNSWGINDYFIFHTGTSHWLETILDTDWAGVFDLHNIQENRIIVQRHNNNRGDIGGERAWEAIQRAVSLGDYDHNPWRAWVGVGRQFNYERISTTPVVYVMDGKWRSDPAGSALNPWQLKPGVGKIFNYRWSPTRTGYWLEDPATFLIDEITVDSTGRITPAMAEISQTENLLTYLASLPTGGGSGGGGGNPGPTPPNWNVEMNRPNELGPGGDTHGYWTVQGGQYVWVHDASINLTSWWNPGTGRVEGL